MSSKQVHRITVSDDASRNSTRTLLAELQASSLRSRTEVGTIVSFVVSHWREDAAGDFTVELSPQAAARLPALSGLELLQAAKGLAEASALLPEAAA
ncbi:MAG: hypothetical protein REI12_02245 [Pedobacter sp.]|nr:hypothetical protein [Pedobacter sp.]